MMRVHVVFQEFLIKRTNNKETNKTTVSVTYNKSHRPACHCCGCTRLRSRVGKKKQYAISQPTVQEQPHCSRQQGLDLDWVPWEAAEGSWIFLKQEFCPLRAVVTLFLPRLPCKLHPHCFPFTISHLFNFISGWQWKHFGDVQESK